MAGKDVYIEQRADKQFTVTVDGESRAAALFGQQADAIDYARRTFVHNEIHVEGVGAPSPDRHKRRRS